MIEEKKKEIRNIFSLFFLIILFTFQTKPGNSQLNYQEIFGDDYQFALNYLEEVKKELVSVASAYSADASMVASIAFPELIRYSKMRDKAELFAMEILYVNYGSTAANFSIGPFQIKPGAIELLERYIKDSLPDNSKLAFLFRYNCFDGQKIRKERLARLRNSRWQLLYLAAFYKVFEHKFSMLFFENKEEKISFYAAAYNHGCNCDIGEIRYWELKNAFPYGAKSNKKQYNYSGIAVDFYKRYSSANIFKTR